MLITQIMKCDMIAKEAQNETNHVINKKHSKFFLHYPQTFKWSGLKQSSPSYTLQQ